MTKQLFILYATVTGNAELCANKIAETAWRFGYEPSVKSLENFDIKQIISNCVALFCVSTYGEGDPPDQAFHFWKDLQHLQADALCDISYAIYALGDSSHDDFCGFGKKLDVELHAKGANRIMERVDNDLDFEEGVPTWCSCIFTVIPNILSPSKA